MRACALVGASDFNSALFLEMDSIQPFYRVIAVDGGLAHLEAIEVKPYMAVGDFDSLGYEPKGIRISKFAKDKDQSDMELALAKARAWDCDSIWVFGALGKRLDHTLANLYVLAAASESGMKVSCIGMDEEVAFVTGPDILEIEARESGIISVFSMSDECTGVFERGLKWELDDCTLSNRTSHGLSNEFIGEAALVGVETGTLAAIMSL